MIVNSPIFFNLGHIPSLRIASNQHFRLVCSLWNDDIFINLALWIFQVQLMDNLHIRLLLENHCKKHDEISKIAQFWREMLKRLRNIFALQSLQILYLTALRVKIVNIFQPNSVFLGHLSVYPVQCIHTLTGSSERQWFIKELKRSSNPGAKTLGSRATKHWPWKWVGKMLLILNSLIWIHRGHVSSESDWSHWKWRIFSTKMAKISISNINIHIKHNLLENVGPTIVQV